MPMGILTAVALSDDPVGYWVSLKWLLIGAVLLTIVSIAAFRFAARKRARR
jgi:hypothetical protein